jgi:hypothetical protein
MTVVGPFRWDVRRPERLGRLIVGERAATYDGFFADLRGCAARVLALGGDSDLMFVGRSPESLYDYLGGALAGTAWAERLGLVQVSLKSLDPDWLVGNEPGAVAGLREYLAGLRLDPPGLIGRRRTVAVVDLVNSGETFARLVQLLETWCRERGWDWTSAHCKLRFVAITWRAERSWRRELDWAGRVPKSRFTDVAIPGTLWDCLGNWQAKTTVSHGWKRWAAPAGPVRERDQLRALRLAAWITERAGSRDEREALHGLLVRQPAVRFRWFRRLCRELRGASGSRARAHA